ncbi:sulfotransferase [Egicoccus sp. AB-alg2]|uniref:sulfotransferase family protein n=1 Tax=Egicoccus sp. AB-alg2 TaxID=3242693 RepID=UPI00359E00E5
MSVHRGCSGPILIAGADRSGTSLMYAMLASHPDISMVRRTNLWRWFHGRYGSLADASNLDRCLDELLRYPRVARLVQDPAGLVREFRHGEPTYGRLFDLLHQQHARATGRPRWGDKSLHTELFVPTILAELPHARVVQMVRDPRDRYASVVKRYDDQSKGVASVMGRWLRSTAAITRNQRLFPAHVLTVRYEDLARAPEATMQQVCDFLEAAYTPRLLAMGDAPDHGAGGNSSFERFAPGVVSTRSIGRFREVLDPRDLAFIQAVAGRRMRELDYAPEPVPWSPPAARTSYLLTQWPVQGARLAGWLASTRFTERRRSVPAERLAPARA